MNARLLSKTGHDRHGRRPRKRASAASSESHGGSTASASADRTELGSLKRQVGGLSEQVQRFLSESAGATLRWVGDAANEVMSDMGAKSCAAAEGVREVTDNLARATDASLKNRPYTTLAMAFGLGFLFARLK